jgi:hypothetical protein
MHPASFYMRSFAAIPCRGLAGLACGLFALLIGNAYLAAAEPIMVEFVDGSVIAGQVDDQTDTERLWLRREDAGIELCSGFAWDQVQAVHRGQSVFRGRAILVALETLKTPGKRFLDIVPATIPIVSDPRTTADCQQSPARPKVQSLRIETELARWGPGAATDGLRIFVYPLSAEGEIVPVRGQLDLTLYAELTNARGGEYTVLRPEFHELESSSELVRVGDFSGGPAVYQLPFGRFHPDVDFDVAACAVVHARLGIAGQGVFEASADCVPLREFSPIRDQLQLYTGRRFFRGENVDLRPRYPRGE